MPDPADEILTLTRRLLDSIVAGDWKTYSGLCDESLTAFEPEAAGHLVEGLGFHKFYFDLGRDGGSRKTTLCGPHVRLMGDVAVVSYVRLNQKVDPNGQPVTLAVDETRVWQKKNGQWKHVHFHRSPAK
jgi:ketosteroid isomerase-like protein